MIGITPECSANYTKLTFESLILFRLFFIVPLQVSIMCFVMQKCIISAVLMPARCTYYMLWQAGIMEYNIIF